MHKWGAEHRGAGKRGGDTGEHLDLDVGLALGDLQDEAGHAVDAAVAAAHHGDGLAGLCLLDCPLAALDLLGHGGRVRGGVREGARHEVDVDVIAADDVCGRQRVVCPKGHLRTLTGPQPYDVYLAHARFLSCSLVS